MSDSEANNSSSLFSKIKKWSIINFFSEVVKDIYTFLTKKVNLIHWFFIIAAVFSLISFYLEICWLISLAGIIWSLIWFGLFILSLSIHKYIDRINDGAGLFYEFNKLSNKFVEVSNNRTNKSHDSTKEDDKLEKIIVFVQKILNAINRHPFTAAGLSIALAHISTLLHTNAAIGVITETFNMNAISWPTWIFVIGSPIYGFFCDKLAKQYGRGVYFLASIQFYVGFLVLLTGFLGGQPAISAICHLVGKPWELISNDLLFYQESYSHKIYVGMGMFSFILFYFFIPSGVAMVAWADIKRYKEGLNVELNLPKTALYCLQYFSILLLLISLFVGWNEGWIATIIMFILWVIAMIIKFVGELYSLIVR